MPSQLVAVDGLRSLSSGSVSGTYNTIGTPFTHLMRLLKIINNSNKDVTISFDGINDNDFIPAGGFSLYDLTTNKSDQDILFIFRIGTQVYAKGTAGTGDIYVVAIYGVGE